MPQIKLNYLFKISNKSKKVKNKLKVEAFKNVN